MKLKTPLWLGLVLSIGSPPALLAAPLQKTLAKHSLTDQVKQRVKRGAYDPKLIPWPDNIVYYALTNANPETRTTFLAAAKVISDNTALRFVERTTEPRYLLIANSSQFDTCAFASGEEHGPQFLILNPAKCYAPDEPVGILLHEVMHALGAEHEHQRDDRVGDVVGGSMDATEINPLLVKHGAFDPDSIMMYESNIFKLPDGLPSRPWPRNTLSAGDIKMLQDRYPASQAKRPVPRATLSNLGIASTISRRIGPLRENETGSITISYPQGITPSMPTIRLYQADRAKGRYSEIKEHDQTAALKLTGVQIKPSPRANQAITIHYQSQTTDSPQNIIMVVDGPGRDERGQAHAASSMLELSVIPNNVLPELKLGALLSGYSISEGTNKCLTMGVLKNNSYPLFDHPEYLGLGQDNAAWFSATQLRQDPVMPVYLAPCDSENLGQRWIYNATSGLITDEDHHYYLDLIAPKPPTAPTGRGFRLQAYRINDKITIPELWQYQGQRFIYRSLPGMALSEMRADKVGLIPIPPRQRAKWQQWSWH